MIAISEPKVHDLGLVATEKHVPLFRLVNNPVMALKMFAASLRKGISPNFVTSAKFDRECFCLNFKSKVQLIKRKRPTTDSYCTSQEAQDHAEGCPMENSCCCHPVAHLLPKLSYCFLYLLINIFNSSLYRELSMSFWMSGSCCFHPVAHLFPKQSYFFS